MGNVISFFADSDTFVLAPFSESEDCDLDRFFVVWQIAPFCSFADELCEDEDELVRDKARFIPLKFVERVDFDWPFDP